MAYNDGVRVTPIAYIGVMSVLVTIIIVMALQIMFFDERDALRTADEASQGPPSELAAATAQQLTTLTRRELVDRQKGIVTIGISRAMDLVVTELDDGQSPSSVIGPHLETGSPGVSGAAAPKAKETEPEADEKESAKKEPSAPPQPAAEPSQEKKKDDAKS